MTFPRTLTVVGLVLLVGGLPLALTMPADQAWFAWMCDQSLAAGVVASGRILILGLPQFVGYGAALLGLLLLAVSAGYVLGRRHDS